MKTVALLLLFIPTIAAAGEKIVRNSMGGDLTVASAPGGAVLRTMGGDIRIDRAGGSVVAKTMGGNIRVGRLEGSLDAGTMGGNVEVEVLGAARDRWIRIWSMGGTIEVTLPNEFAANFDVELEQSHEGRPHRIVSDFPLQIRESTRRRWFREVSVLSATGRNGAGGNRVRLSTVGADIRIVRK
jgi:DUF4097 and DUF4098 domain-containing protein YvlB